MSNNIRPKLMPHRYPRLNSLYLGAYIDAYLCAFKRHGREQLHTATRQQLKRSATLPYVTKYNIYNGNAHMAHNIYLN